MLPMPTPFADIAWSKESRYWLSHARVPACLLSGVESLGAADSEGVVDADILIEDGNIARIAAPGHAGSDGIETIQLGDRQVWPTLIDIHAHLDKAHTVERSPNVDGTFNNARLGAAADRANWTAADLRRRMGFGLRTAYVHGV